LILTVLAGLAEFERGLIVERTGEGRDRAMEQGVVFRPQAEIDLPPAPGGDCTAQRGRADRVDRAELQRASLEDLAAGGLTVTRNTVLRLLPLLPMTLLFGSLVGEPAFGYGVLLAAGACRQWRSAA
jgi:DNA invertase Pin-like site-specific DNA recombinase